MYSVNSHTKKKEDAHLHGPILASGAKHALVERQSARERAAKLHKLTDAELDRAFGRGSRIKQRAAGGRVLASNIDHFPSEAQKRAGNYPKDHVWIQGLDITIENAKGSERRGIGKDGKEWRCKLENHYGYLRKTEGSDGDHLDVYLGPYTKSKKVFIIDQIDANTRKFDEHKVILCMVSLKFAVQSYVKSFSDGKGYDRIGAIVEMPMDKFKEWLAKADTTKPISIGKELG